MSESSVFSRFPRIWLVGYLLLAGFSVPVSAQTDQSIYTDSLQNGWEDWGWTEINYSANSVVHSGSFAIAVTITNAWQGIYISHAAFDSSPYTNLTFWINGGSSGGQQLWVQGLLGSTAQPAVTLPAPAANTWREITVSLNDLNVAGQANFTGFWIQDSLGSAQPTFYLDDITLTAQSTTPVTNTPVLISVDAEGDRHPISPLIYGVAFASPGELAELNFTVNRSGGNAETRYNWQIDAHNRGADWYFESIGDSPTGVPGASADAFIADGKSGGAEPMITIPMIGWMPKLGPNHGNLSSYSIAKYGPQTGSDPWMPDAGNGVGTNSVTHATWLITTNDPNDANFLTNSTFQQAWVEHLTNTWGTATNGGVRFYIMDNEETLWFSTHRDVYPVGPTMQDIRDKFLDYATMVKNVDPNALVVAPEAWGWSGYFYSGYDQQWAGAHNDYNPAHYPDRTANGGWDYLPWLLDQIRQHDTATGRRLLDYFTVHCYPQESGVGGGDVSTATELLRNQSTRVFWDTNYVDPSWINSVVMLIPRMKQWVATYYPGTKIGITEYNWGAEDNINGATTQADLLGIFGREGLDLATRWTTPTNTSPTFKAMQMYRNYDGNDSTFGDTSVSATGPNPDNVSTFAAIRSADGALTVMVVNKQLSASATVTLDVTNFPSAGTAQEWQLTAANVISRLGDISFTGRWFTNTVPPQSITLFVLPPGTPPAPQLHVDELSATNTFNLRLDGTAGFRYLILSSTNLIDWRPLWTNTLSADSTNLEFPASDTLEFYRARWVSP